jgi:cellulose biosynthesis protein BcsQ
MHAIAFFNNKGGVGKTTLICNVAWQLARAGRRVLMVDGDPQCNTTQLVLPAEVCDLLYGTEGDRDTHTLLQVVRPISDGDASINTSIEPLSRSDNRFEVDIIPGHPRMSVVEDQFSQAWAGTRAGDIGGLRRTNWASQLCATVGRDYDLVFFDLGPSLGSLNRTVLIGCDNFVTPMGCDIFSIVGIRNIADWLGEAVTIYERSLQLCADEDLVRHNVRKHVAVATGFAGYTVQQYITKSKQGERRATGAFEAILSKIPGEIDTTLHSFLLEGLDKEKAKLGDVPNMFSIIPLAQSANAPIGDLHYSDGLRGSQFQQQESYAEKIANVTQSLASNIGL